MYKMSAPQLSEPVVVLDSDESDEELPENVILGSDFDIRTIAPSSHLFFDDHPYNIIPVQDMANKNKLDLKSVWCLPTRMTLYSIEGEPRIFDCANQEEKDAYYKLKLTAAASFVRDVPRSTPRKIGTGITGEIIQQIIAKEREQTRQGVYFFDFDMLLSQFNELAFPEIDDLEWFEQYAKYLFSDYIGVEPPKGRLNLLKSMFGAIGPDRIYIITANGTATDTNPQRINFIKLINVLLPTFIPDHLRFGRRKSDVIVDILESESRPNGGARSTTRKTRSKARKSRRTRSKARKSRRTRSKARKTMTRARRTKMITKSNRCSRKKA
jgi:hypothetical protein